MNDEKWGEVKYNIQEKFGLEEEIKEEDNLEDDLGNVVKGEKEIIIFNNPMGKMKLERVVRPLIEDKKMHYHKGTGGTARVEFVVSKTESSHSVKAFLFDEENNDWNELELPKGQITF